MSTLNLLNILDDDVIKVNQDCVITLTKDTKDNLSPETRKKCKILKFSADFSFDEVFVELTRLDLKAHPQLFFFIIELEEAGPEILKILKNFVTNYFKNRPVILQLSIGWIKELKYFFKDENSTKFIDIKEQKFFTFFTKGSFSDFRSFFWHYLNRKIDNFEDVMLEKLPNVKNSSLILKFLRTLELTEDFLAKLVVKVASAGSESDLLAVTDGFIDDEGKIQGYELEKFLTDEVNSTSVLHTAVTSSNTKIINFLITKCANLIQQLPFPHQVEITTAAFTSGQFDVLCDLVETCDFPFPENLNINLISIKRLRKIINSRTELHKAILAEDLGKIKDFYRTNLDIKYGYNLKNVSALCNALDSGKFKAFFHLKSLRFQDNEIDNYDDSSKDDAEKSKIKRLAGIQRRENINIASGNKDQAIVTLTSKSFIYNRNEKKKADEEQQHEMIKKWYKDIYKTKFGCKLIDAAAQCDKLKIIFDFECESVENVDITASSDSQGTTYPGSKWIFIGAKLTGQQQREQLIKGVIIHEICHYVMRLVYHNNEKPYYADEKDCCAEFENIVTEIQEMLDQKEHKPTTKHESQESDGQEENVKEITDDVENEETKEVGDKCGGLISSVYTCYNAEDWHPEIIVRPAQIQAQYDDNEEKLNELEEFYKRLFKFFEQFVIPEIKIFSLQKRGKIQGFNDWIGILNELKESQINLTTTGNIKDLFSNDLTIITTNIPKLLLVDIYSRLAEKYKDLIDVKNIFINTEVLEKPTINKKFEIIIKEKSNLNIIVDCTKEFGTNLELSRGKDLKLILVTLRDQKSNKVVSEIKEKFTNQGEIAINYNWMDLTEDSQKYLLQTKVNFQDNSTISFSELVLNEINAQQPDLEDIKFIIDDQLLNLMLEKSEIRINQQVQETIESKKFRIIFQDRSLIKKYKIIEQIKTLNKEGIKDNELGDTNRHSIKNNESNHGTTAQNDFKCEMKELEGIKNLVEKNLSQFKEIDKTEQISQDQMLEDVKNRKFVLISDKAGSGKSWVLKNFTNKLKEKYPSKWITYVDLKLYIQHYKQQDTKHNFSSFMVDKIFKPKSKFESEIFQKLYKNGKICILFDGFDEIAPNCAEFVTKLFQSFQQNGRNQLWIATRDYFEVDLKKKLEIDIVYKLDEFTEKLGVELIALSWILSENEQDFLVMAETDAATQIRSSQQFQDYKEMSTRIIKKVPKAQNNTIGLPQFYKMIADITQKNKEAAINFGMFIMFEECVSIQYERWSQQKGELRLKANTASQDLGLNYQTLHQLIAIKAIFPSETQYCDLNIEDLENWIDEEIIACGMLNKVYETFLWSHETFREYFVAKFILRILMKPGKRDDDQVCEYLMQILTIEKFGIIRTFLNDALADESTLVKIENKIPKICENFCKNVEDMENLDQCFWENLDSLGNLLIKIFENGNYEEMKEILLKNKKIFPASTGSPKLFDKFKKLVMSFLKENDLRDFMINNEIFLHIFDFDLDAEAIKRFLKETEDKLGANFVKNSLQMKDNYGENLFFYLIQSEIFSSDLFQKVIQILKIYFNINEIIDLIKERNEDGLNILHYHVWMENGGKLETLWNSLELFYKYENISEEFKNLLSENSSDEAKNILHLAAQCEKIEFHQTFWRLLLNTYENRDELKDLIMKRDKDGDNFIRFLVIFKKPEIIELLITKLKENFSNDQNEEILMSKGQTGRNLLQKAVCATIDIKTHQILWKIFRDLFNSNKEFLEFLNEVDDQNNNVFHVAATFTSNEIFEFIINELDKTASNEEFKNILKTLGLANRNLLQSAAEVNKSVELHEYLWSLMRKYFSSQEIMEMIKQTDKYGDNLLFNTVEWNTKEVLEISWIEIKKVFYKIEDTTEIQAYLSTVNNNHENILHILIRGKNSEKLKFLWSQIQFYFTSQLKNLLSQKSTNYEQNVLHYAAKCDDISFFKVFYELLVKTFENQENLKDLLMQGDKNGDNFVHNLVIYNKPEIIEFIITRIKENFSNDQKEEILMSKGYTGRNLLQLAACASIDIKTHQILWKIFRDFYKSDEELLEYFKEVDTNGSNVFILAACFTSKEIFEFMINELEKLSIKEEKRNILKTLGFKNQNLLQSAARLNKCLDFHDYLWATMGKYFNEQEMLDMIKHNNELGNNLLFDAVECNTKEVLEMTWQKIKNVADKTAIQGYLNAVNNQQENVLHILIESKDLEKIKFLWTELINYLTSLQIRELLSQKTKEHEQNILHYAAKFDDIEFHVNFWEFLFKISEENDELKGLIMQGDKDGDNFVHFLVIYNKPEIIEFTISKLKENFNNEQYEEILMSKGQFGRNLLQLAACSSNDIKTHQILWKIFRDLCNSDGDFLKFLKEVDTNGSDIFHLAAYFTSKEIFEFIVNELEKIATNEEIEYILRTFGNVNLNLLQSAVVQNESVKFHEYLWSLMRKYFSSQEIIDMIKQTDEYGNNLLFSAVECNTKEVLELTWTRIKNVADENAIQGYLSAVNNQQENVLHILIRSKNLEKIKCLWTELEKYLTSQQMRELLSQKTKEFKQNVLHYAVKFGDIELHVNFWEFLLKTFENQDELKDLIMQGNKNANNFVHNLVMCRESNVIEFYIEKLKKFFNVDHFEDILRSKGYFNRNLLQSAAENNKSLEVHQILWKINQETFDNSQMLEIIKHIDEIGGDLFMTAVKENTEEVVRFIWLELRGILVTDEKLLDQLKECEEQLTIVLKNPSNLQELETMKVKWNKLVEDFGVLDSQKEMERILKKEKSVKDIKTLHRLAICDKLVNHEALWKILLNSFQNIEDLKEFIVRKGLSGNNYLHVLVLNDNSDIIEFTIEFLKKSFNEDQLGEILQSKGELERNLLQIAAEKPKNIKIHQILWNFYQNFCKSNEEFLEIIKQVDKNGSNVLHIAASASTAEILQFMIEFLEEVVTKNEIKFLLTTSGFWNENLFQVAAFLNNSLKLHEMLWKIIKKYFNSSEILEMINYCDRSGDHILHDVITWNTKEIVEFTWTQIKKFIQTKEIQTEYLSRKGHYSHNLLQMSTENQSKDPKVKKWVQNIMNEYKIEFNEDED